MLPTVHEDQPTLWWYWRGEYPALTDGWRALTGRKRRRFTSLEGWDKSYATAAGLTSKADSSTRDISTRVSIASPLYFLKAAPITAMAPVPWRRAGA